LNKKLKITASTLKIDELLRNKIIHFHKKKNNEFFAYTKQISVLKVFLKDHVTLNDAENSVQE